MPGSAVDGCQSGAGTVIVGVDSLGIAGVAVNIEDGLAFVGVDDVDEAILQSGLELIGIEGALLGDGDRVVGVRAGEIVFDGPASTITQEQIDFVYNGTKAPTLGDGE